jgi:hypothetical protein
LIGHFPPLPLGFIPRKFRVSPASSDSEGLAGLYEDKNVSGNKDLPYQIVLFQEKKKGDTPLKFSRPNKEARIY